MLKLLNKDLQGLVMCHRSVQGSIWVGCSGLDEVGLGSPATMASAYFGCICRGEGEGNS